MGDMLEQQTGSETPRGWTCFHCGEHFPDTKEGIRDARDHFGTDTEADPACIMRLDGGDKAFLRLLCDMQNELARYQDEDSDVMRHLAKKTGEHARQLALAEETGFARGLEAGFKHWAEAFALLTLDETASPISHCTLEEGDDGRFVQCDLDAKDAIVTARLTLAQAIRTLTSAEARDILDANRTCAATESGTSQARPGDAK